MTEPQYLKIEGLSADSKTTKIEQPSYHKNGALKTKANIASIEFLTAQIRSERRLIKKSLLKKLSDSLFK